MSEETERTVRSVVNWAMLAFVGIIAYLAKEVRDDVKQMKSISTEERITDARQDEVLRVHELRITKLEK